MSYLLTFIHIVVCFFLIVVVLLQSGKAADLAGAFGGMGSQTTFGPRGSATVLSKATTISAAMFMLTALFLNVVMVRSAAGSHSVLPGAKPVAPKTAPAQTGPAPQPGAVVIPEGGKTSTVPVPMPATGQPAGGAPQQTPPPAPNK